MPEQDESEPEESETEKSKTEESEPDDGFDTEPGGFSTEPAYRSEREARQGTEREEEREGFPTERET